MFKPYKVRVEKEEDLMWNAVRKEDNDPYPLSLSLQEDFTSGTRSENFTNFSCIQTFFFLVECPKTT